MSLCAKVAISITYSIRGLPISMQSLPELKNIPPDLTSTRAPTRHTPRGACWVRY